MTDPYQTLMTIETAVNGQTFSILKRRPITWCVVHSSNGRGPGRLGEACHYSGLQQATLKKTPGPCEFSDGGPDHRWWIDA